ncbi:hypothetical protein [Stigmatella aurantiaca]|uniref:Uncharacterized protein n=1 Tax=Stigmatella aurantiaca (strain DW4/3-1) TaxID=378806 RepID=Q08X82_STIAD|nr:hypothetical protein [Stigmatella aurantiaca]ADO75897.1 uncharacterized protein STAUR_8142 [Stigmatella aurantiaca DW4/3-1]EAU65087.1 hypothetical protein STIAU_3262 [Stigmatella aurantiaca DW4/3-1]
MPRHPKGPSFIQYELPVRLGGRPPAPVEQGGKEKPRPVTTLAVGEEGGGPPPGLITTMSLREEGGTHGG